MTVQRGDDLVRFDAVSVDLFLAVHAPAECDLSVLENATEIAGSIHARGQGIRWILQ